MKKKISMFLAVMTLLTLIVSPLMYVRAADDEDDEVPAPDVTHAKAAALYNVENDYFMYTKNAEEQMYPASTVKLMTAIIVMEALGTDLDREITATREALSKVQGNHIKIRRDEILTARQLLSAMLIGNANDATNILAIEVAGSIEAFVSMMNDKAEEIGATHTYYMNPTGIHHPSMKTTAEDTAKIAAYACSYETITEITSMEVLVIEPTNLRGRRTIYNKNYYFATNMQYKYIWSVPRGLNAGYTEEAGYCIATSAAKDGLTYISIVLGAEADEKYIYSFTEAASMLKWALAEWGYVKILTTSDMICEMPVRLSGRVDYVTLFPSQDIELFIPLRTDLATEVTMTPTLTKEYFTAPVDEGEVGGNIVVTYKGQSLGTYDLVTRNSVSRSNILYVFDVLKSLARTTQFKVILAIAAAMAVGYVGVLVYLALPKKPKNIRGRQGTPNRHGRSGGNRPGAAPRNGGVNYQRPNRPGTPGGNRPSNGQRPSGRPEQSQRRTNDPRGNGR